MSEQSRSTFRYTAGRWQHAVGLTSALGLVALCGATDSVCVAQSPPLQKPAVQELTEQQPTTQQPTTQTSPRRPSPPQQSPPQQSPQQPWTPAADQPSDGKSADYWASQLSSDSYNRRRSATRQLLKRGMSAVPALEKALESGDLEATRRVVDVLQALIAQETRSVDVSTAWDLLKKLSVSGTGSQSSLAATAIQGVLKERHELSKLNLVAAGVDVGISETRIMSSPVSMPIVSIGDGWNGELEPLDWLRWVRGFKAVRIEGAAVTPEVLEKVIRIPDLETIVLKNAQVDTATLAPLAKLSRIRMLEFRYTKLDDALAAEIEQLPIRAALSLMGSGLSAERVAKLREALPGLKVEYKNGGFLGVTGSRFLGDCLLETIDPNGAADKAGLQRGDVVVAINGKSIKTFADLVDVVSPLYAGDVIAMKYLRQGKLRSARVTLGTLESE